MTEKRKSALVRAKDAQPREAPIFTIGGFLGLGGTPIHKVGVRVNVKGEENRAGVAAHRYVQEIAAGVDEAKKDPDLLDDEKLIQALYESFLEVETKDGKDVLVLAIDGTPYKAFASPAWMRDTLTTDQLATLNNLYLEVKHAQRGGPKDVNDETVEAVAAQCAAAALTPIPSATLAQIPRYILTELLVLMAVKLQTARAETAAAQAQVDALLSADEVVAAEVAASDEPAKPVSSTEDAPPP